MMKDEWQRELVLAVIGILSVILLKFWWSRRRFRELAGKIPGPPSVPLLGNLLMFMTDPDKIFSQMREYWFQNQGSPFRIWFGTALCIVVTTPEDVERLLTNNRVLNRIRYLMKPLIAPFGNGLITCRADTWKKKRKIANPFFHSKAVVRYVPTFDKQSRVLIDRLKKVADGQPFDMYNLLLSCTGDMICESGLGYSLGLQADESEYKAKLLNRMEHVVTERVRRPWLYCDFIYNLTSLGREQKFGTDFLRTFSKIVIERTFEEHSKMEPSLETSDEIWMEKGLNFAHHIVRAFEKEGKPVDKDYMRDELHTIGLAGMDTTAVSVSFVLIFLGLYPKWQEIIYEELKEMYADDWERAVTIEDIKQMKCLDRFTKETMRLMPAVPVIPREVDEELELSTCTLPAGCSAIVMNYFIHRDPRNWPDPERFDPDRFLPERSKDRHPYSYIPFGAGPRMCVGFKYAEVAMMTTIASVMKKYRMLPAVTYEDLQNLDLGIVFRPTCGFLVRMLPREHSQS